MGNEVFLDTSYAITLSSPKDNLHEKADKQQASFRALLREK